MWKYMYNDELYHYGVLGMKWGIRRYQNKDGTLTPNGRKKLLEKANKFESKAGKSVATNYLARSRKARLLQDAKDIRKEVRRSDLAKARKTKTENETAKKNKKKKVSEMTDDEINAAIARFKLEESYNSYLPKKYATKEKGKEIVFDILEKSAKNIGQQAVTYALGKGVNKIFKELVGEDIVNPKKGQKDK